MTRAVGVAFIAPSVTTFVNLNPGADKTYSFDQCFKFFLEVFTFVLMPQHEHAIFVCTFLYIILIFVRFLYKDTVCTMLMATTLAAAALSWITRPSLSTLH